jgi:uncharacterized protein YecT (DUF1311 family)
MMEINWNACAASEAAEKNLNRVYGQILATNAGDKNFLEAIKAAQIAWRLFRNAHIKAVYPDPDPMHAYGALHAACHCTLLATITQERTNELRKRWIIGTDEEDACAGSSPRHPKVEGRPTTKQRQ